MFTLQSASAVCFFCAHLHETGIYYTGRNSHHRQHPCPNPQRCCRVEMAYPRGDEEWQGFPGIPCTRRHLSKHVVFADGLCDVAVATRPLDLHLYIKQDRFHKTFSSSCQHDYDSNPSSSHFSPFWARLPNSLIKDHVAWELDISARDRLDATVLFLLASALPSRFRADNSADTKNPPPLGMTRYVSCDSRPKSASDIMLKKLHYTSKRSSKRSARKGKSSVQARQGR